MIDLWADNFDVDSASAVYLLVAVAAIVARCNEEETGASAAEVLRNAASCHVESLLVDERKRFLGNIDVKTKIQ